MDVVWKSAQEIESRAVEVAQLQEKLIPEAASAKTTDNMKERSSST
jgi:hypothetical protein